MLYEITILLCLTINILFILKFNTIASIVNLFDIPDNKRKLHKDKVALLGGLLLFLCLIIFSINLLQNDTKFLNNFEFSKKIFSTFNFFFFFMFLFGFYDDKKSLNPNLKLFLVFIIVLLYTFLIIALLSDLKFSFTERTINLKYMSLPVTILCYLLFINAFNMFDGINLQCGIYSLSIILFLFLFEAFSNFLLFLLIPLITFIILNFKNKCFFR